MSLIAIKEFYRKSDETKRFSRSSNESTLRNDFFNLLNEYARPKGLLMATESTIKASNSNKNIRPDATLFDSYNQTCGYWESKDTHDILNEEIKKKFNKGYPKDNIIFEDSQTAVLIQNHHEVMRVVIKDAPSLHKLISAFIAFERPEVRAFREAIEKFKQAIPDVTEKLRFVINQQEQNQDYVIASRSFLELCQHCINPKVSKEDVREMLIQHILTEPIFTKIFSDNQFHRENNIAKKLESVLQTFFTGQLKKETFFDLQDYYDAINARAANIPDHHEKQKFLKVIYETFYQGYYSTKEADRLGIVYTPVEIVRFMIESTDYLLHTYFDKFLEDEDVEILDPATGTGTFICDLIDYIHSDKLEYKYKTELHANEVAILPYYISNLNIEATYSQKMGKPISFENLCFVDTLDNMDFSYHGKQDDMTSFSEENTKRIKNQNGKKISVVIGNPPYNANQLNENDNNKNREYPKIDDFIKKTFIAESTAQKTKVYDMYARFLRWSINRIEKNGIIAFVSNNSFIDSRTFDGFRKIIGEEFNYCYIINLKGNARTSGERRKKEGGNVFLDKIRVGIAVYFFIKVPNEKKFTLYYNEIDDYVKAEEKLQYLAERKLKNISFKHIQPDKNNNWINLAEVNDWQSLLPIADKEVKAGKSGKAIFKLFSLGVVTNRDEWVYDDSEKNLKIKVKHLIQSYNNDVKKLKGVAVKDIADNLDYSIKWTRAVKNDLSKGIKYKFYDNLIVNSLYRPFIKKKLYFSSQLNEMQYQMPIIFKNGESNNKIIAINTSNKSFNILSSKYLVDLHFNGDSQCLSLYAYDKYGIRNDNITHTALDLFKKYYQNNEIMKEDIFHYVYAVLHNPHYLKKYELNLKRDFPRIPFYENFMQWADFGRQLMNLHLNYETAEPYPLKRQDLPGFKNLEGLKVKLKADKEHGLILIDEKTTLNEIPAIAWEYKLGNRSALEWILDQYKEKKIKDDTVREQFNTYRFADYKEQVIELLTRVCTVSVETVRIIQIMNQIDTK